MFFLVSRNIRDCPSSDFAPNSMQKMFALSASGRASGKQPAPRPVGRPPPPLEPMPVLPTHDNARNALDLPTGLHKTMPRKEFKDLILDLDADQVYIGEILSPPGFPHPQIDIYSETWVSGGAGSVEPETVTVNRHHAHRYPCLVFSKDSMATRLRGAGSHGGQIRWATANFIRGTSGSHVGIPRAAVEEFHLKNGTWAGSPYKEEFEVRKVTKN